jgi:hypothetical protein
MYSKSQYYPVMKKERARKKVMESWLVIVNAKGVKPIRLENRMKRKREKI